MLLVTWLVHLLKDHGPAPVFCFNSVDCIQRDAAQLALHDAPSHHHL
jgi:hypothetical protein